VVTSAITSDGYAAVRVSCGGLFLVVDAALGGLLEIVGALSNGVEGKETKWKPKVKPNKSLISAGWR
jgi:hypothetical protein